MSRADVVPRARPAASVPGLGASLRAAVLDFYYHSIRLVPANLAWGAVLLVVLGLGLLFHPLWGLVLAPLLGPPLVGVATIAGTAARGRDVVLSDAWTAARQRAGVAIAAAALIVVAGAVLVANVVAGLTSDGPVGWLIATLAGWGFVVLAMGCPVFWVLLADPGGADGSVGRTARDAARLTGLLLLAQPGRMVKLGLVVGIVIAASTVLFAALPTISVAFAMCVAARATYPAADRLVAA